MATETKLAYVVGLAFIICFAVILARRGQHPPLGENGLDRVPIIDLGTVSGGPVPPAVKRSTSGGPIGGAEEVVSSAASAASDDVLSGATLRDRPSSHPSASSGVTKALGAMTREASEKLDALINGAAGRRSTGESAPSAELPEGAVASHTSAGNGDALLTSDAPPIILARHTVAKGETLMQIARRHYRDQWKQGIDALMVANRDILKDPNQIRIGVELTVPSLKPTSVAIVDAAAVRTGGSGPSRDRLAGGDKATGSSQTGGRGASPGLKTIEYEVRKGDTLYSIARQFMGDQSRWREIHQLNKERFPDPAMVREGAKIRVPQGDLPAGSGRKRST